MTQSPETSNPKKLALIENHSISDHSTTSNSSVDRQTFSDRQQLSQWIDQELLDLEAKYSAYVTRNSLAKNLSR